MLLIDIYINISVISIGGKTLVISLYYLTKESALQLFFYIIEFSISKLLYRFCFNLIDTSITYTKLLILFYRFLCPRSVNNRFLYQFCSRGASLNSVLYRYIVQSIFMIYIVYDSLDSVLYRYIDIQIYSLNSDLYRYMFIVSIVIYIDIDI